MSGVLKKEMVEAKEPALKYGGFDKPIRICLKFGNYKSLPTPFTYGIVRNASIGIDMTRKKFKEYCK